MKQLLATLCVVFGAMILVCCCGLLLISRNTDRPQMADMQDPAARHQQRPSMRPEAKQPRTETRGDATSHTERDVAAEDYEGQATELPASIQPQHWTDDTGKFSTEATFKQYSNYEVTLVKPNGSTVVVPFKRLSEPDKDYVRMISKSDIPNVHRGRVTTVTSSRSIIVVDDADHSENVILDNVSLGGDDAKKQLVALVFKKVVTVYWYKRSPNRGIIGRVVVNGTCINHQVDEIAVSNPEKSKREELVEYRSRQRVRLQREREELAQWESIAAQQWAASSYMNAAGGGRDVWVNGYIRRDGTYVNGYYRSR